MQMRTRRERLEKPPSMAAVIRSSPSGARRRLLAVLAALALVAVAVLAGVAYRPPAEYPGPPARLPALGDLWTGRAGLVLDRRWTSTSLGQPQGGSYAGSKVEVSDGHWFLFNRY